MKTLLNVDDMIKHLKNKGIKFNIIDEKEAKNFLEKSNYYLKLGSYRNNYEKIRDGKNQGMYRNLEFAYLVELSKLDMYLRYIILKMCLDIEHSLKVILLNRIENNPNDDGYELTRRFIKQYPNTLQYILRHQSSEYCRELIDKYYPYFPIWVFVEVISFGDLTKLCWFYGENYMDQIIDSRLLNSVRDLRNASAHSNCLINKLNSSNNTPLQVIVEYVNNMPEIGSNTRKKKLKNKFVYDFTTLIYVYNNIVKSEALKNNRFEELDSLINNRFYKNKNFFTSNPLITSTFKFLSNIIDNAKKR